MTLWWCWWCGVRLPACPSRYREFYALDTSLRATFPDLESQLPLLPPKEWLFTSLSPHVVYRRQRAFEVYLSHIVMNLPVVLR